MLKRACVFFLIFLVASAEVISSSNEISKNSLEKRSRFDGLGTTADINNYIDETVTLLVPFFQNNGLDPMNLPELVEGFEVKVILITYSAWLKIHNGYMTGLINISRDGDQSVSYYDNMLRIKLKVKFTDLEIIYKYLVQVMKIGPTGGIEASLSRFSVDIDILIDFNNDEIQIQKFKLTDTGKLKVKFTGNILTDWLVNPVLKVFVTLFNTVIIKVVELNIRSFVQKSITELNGNIKSVTDYLESFN